MSKSDLLLELYSNLSTTGALAFSSKALVNKMLTYTDIEHAKLIVELGGGDGSISQGIIDRLSPEGELLIFEINESFCDSMRKQFPQSNIKVICDSAEHIDRYLGGRESRLHRFIATLYHPPKRGHRQDSFHQQGLALSQRKDGHHDLFLSSQKTLQKVLFPSGGEIYL